MKMVLVRKAAALLLITGGLLSCSDDNGGGEYIPPDSGVVFVLGGESGSSDTASLSFSSPWQVAVLPDGFEVSPASGDAGEVVMTVTSSSSNPRVGEAEASFTVTDGSSESVYRIIQRGLPQTVPAVEELSVSQGASETVLAVDANIPFEPEVSSDWLEVQSVTASEPVLLSDGETESDSLRYEIVLRVSENTSGAERTASVVLVSAAGETEVSVVQAAPLSVDWDREFFRTSVFLRFTATWCYNCPYMSEALHTAMDDRPDRIIPVNLHATSSEGGLGFWKAGDYEELYGVTGYPSGVVNNLVKVSASHDVPVLAGTIDSVADEAIASYPARTGIRAESRIDGNTLNVDMSVAVKEADEYRVCVYLLESGIEYAQEGASYDYVHDAVLRAVLTDDIQGDPLPSVEAQDVIEYSIEAEIPRSVLEPGNLSVVIAVVRPCTADVQGVSGVQYMGLGYIYDNAVSLPADGFTDIRYEE